MYDDLVDVRGELLDAKLALRRISISLGSEKRYPQTAAGWDQIAQQVDFICAQLRELKKICNMPPDA